MLCMKRSLALSPQHWLHLHLSVAEEAATPRTQYLLQSHTNWIHSKQWALQSNLFRIHQTWEMTEGTETHSDWRSGRPCCQKWWHHQAQSMVNLGVGGKMALARPEFFDICSCCQSFGGLLISYSCWSVIVINRSCSRVVAEMQRVSNPTLQSLPTLKTSSFWKNIWPKIFSSFPSIRSK